MKNRIMQLGLLTAFLFTSLAAAAQVQTASQFRVHIPFDFTVRDKAFRAGDYSINFGGLTQSRNTVIIRSADGKDVALLSVMPEQLEKSTNDSKLVFVNSDGRYALAELKTPYQRAKIGRPKSGVNYAANFRLVELALVR